VTYQPARLTDAELLAAYPEARHIVPAKIRELSAERRDIMLSIQLFQIRIREIAEAEGRDDVFVWFWGEAYIRYFYAPRVVDLNRRIYRLKMLCNTFEAKKDKKPDKKLEWEARKSQAKSTPIDQVTASYLSRPRRYGNRITALCPLHEERTPSFTVYIGTNRYHCYGCGASGDAIDFIRATEKIDYAEAVRRLAV